MSFKTVLSLLAAIQAVQADFSHPLHFKKVDAVAAKSIATAKGRLVQGTADLWADQVIGELQLAHGIISSQNTNIHRAFGSPTSPLVAAPTWRSLLILAPLTPS